MFPGIILQLTYWYRADEMMIRLLYYCQYLLMAFRVRVCVCAKRLSPDSFEFFANIVSAVLAFGFDNISGNGGLSGWQW